MASSGASSSLASLLRLASFVICLIVAASFLVFVVNQTSSASTHQQEELNGSAHTPAPKHESSLHKTLDEASDFFTSPFAGVVAGSSSQWAIHGVKAVLALLVYGLGLSYLARVIRVRV
ncbi:MAG: hypothetical protein ACRDK7_01325 [Solirubrobacteraceae bacterium]